jgi:aminopeptidase N
MIRVARALALSLLLVSLCAAEETPYRTPPDRPIDVTAIDLDLRVDLKAKQVQGKATLELTAVRDVEGVRLDAVDMDIAGVYSAGADLSKHDYDYDGETLWIKTALKRGESAALRVDYTVTEPKGGLHFFGPTEDAPDVPWQVWSQGETEHNRHWIPCVDHPSERQRTSMSVTVESGLTVISNGTLVKKTERDGLTSWRYEQDREHVVYLVTLVVGTFDAATDTWRGKPLGYYVPPGRADDIPRSFAKTKAMLDAFTEMTGLEYPWPKYDQVVVEQFGWGGMENTGATTLNERTLHDARAHLDYSSEGLVAHELAHQWFGDLITCQDWTHLWLNESFATYFANLWVEHSKGAEEFAYDMLRTADRGRGAGRDRPIADRHYPHPGSMFDGRAYPKGACVLHQLRRRLGDDAFWRGIRLYVSRHKDSSTETTMFRRAMEEVSGQNLERFFHDFIDRPGVPKLDVKLQRDAERGLLTVTVKQTQGGAPYAFPAELLFRFGDEEVCHTFPVDQTEARFLIPEKRAPTLFRFDPREVVLLKELKVHKSRELWLEQLQSDDTSGRVWAARKLGDDRSPQAVGGLVAALSDDPFWGVRAEAATALGKSDRDDARAALRTGALEQEHPKVRKACVESLRKQGRHEAGAAVLSTILTQGDASYYVEAAAVEAYARAAEAPKDVLVAQLTKDSHNDVIRTATLRALAELDDASLVPTFVAYTQPRFEQGVRQAAARALAVARLPGTDEALREQATLALVAYLQTGGRRGRRAALDGLHALAGEAREALEAVEAVAATDVEEGLRDYAGTVAGRIRSGTQPSVELKRLREQLDELRESKGSLERRVDELETLGKGEASSAGGK